MIKAYKYTINIPYNVSDDPELNSFVIILIQ